MTDRYSVLMCVYHKENPKYFTLAIESMLYQTIPTDDFVLVCDGALTDALDNVIKKFVLLYPDIFHVFRLDKNVGLGNALRQGVHFCKHELIARMDSDDISIPERCEILLSEFDRDSTLSLCGGQIAEFEDDPKQITGMRTVPLIHKEIIRFSKKRNPMNHVTVMFKKQAVIDAGNYQEVHLAEDYYLWIRMFMDDKKAANVDEVLVYVRTGMDMYQRRGGFSYAKSLCQMQTILFQLHYIDIFRYLLNCIIRSTVYLLPCSWRARIYKNGLRKK